jgi:hypothetical protein
MQKLYFLLFLWLGLGRLAQATLPEAEPRAGHSLAEVLNADGTLRPGLNGSFAPTGYELVSVAGARQPQFRPVQARRVQGPGDEKWQAGFGIPGVGGPVQAIVCRGTEVYVGGYSHAAGTEAVNYAAKWDGTAWTDMGAGLRGPVYAMAIDRSGTVYAGGSV